MALCILACIIFGVVLFESNPTGVGNEEILVEVAEGVDDESVMNVISDV